MSQYFWGYIFAPIFDILKNNNVNNSKDDLIKALKEGSIWYENGAFKTKNRFPNNIAKTLEEMGARYVRHSYILDKSKLSVDLLNIISFSNMYSLQKATLINEFLAGLISFLKTTSVDDFIELTVKKMYKKLELDILKSAQEYKLPILELGIVTPQIKIPKTKQKEIKTYWQKQDEKTNKLRKKIEKAKTLEEKDEAREKLIKHQTETYKNAPSINIEVDQYELNKISQKIADDYIYNMNYWIKKWEVKNIIEMRNEITNLVQKGVRVSQLQEYFEKRWKIAKNKALFLAENESRLAGSVIQATQYKKLGCTQFKWGRSTSIEKRKLHKEYYGQIFDFNNPPIIDEKLGIKGLPRQIWNCKCQMLCIAPNLAESIKKAEEIRNAKRNIIKYIEYRIKNSKQLDNSAWRYRRFG